MDRVYVCVNTPLNACWRRRQCRTYAAKNMETLSLSADKIELHEFRLMQ